MKLMGSVVLFMEALVTGFALLLARANHSGIDLLLGGLLAIALLISPYFLRMKRAEIGWIIGSILQLAVLSYGFVVSIMWFLGAIYLTLWICAYLVGRRGEAIARSLRKDA